MTDNFGPAEDIDLIKKELKLYKNRSKFISFASSTLVVIVICFIVSILLMSSGIGVDAIDREMHLSQFTMSMVKIFFGVSPTIIYLYIGWNYIRSLCDIFYEELTDLFERIIIFVKGGRNAIGKINSENN